MPLNILSITRIHWNAGAACVSECMRKTLACRGLRVGPSKIMTHELLFTKICLNLGVQSWSLCRRRSPPCNFGVPRDICWDRLIRFQGTYWHQTENPSKLPKKYKFPSHDPAPKQKENYKKARKNCNFRSNFRALSVVIF